jgi:hypothetical protein
MSEQELEEMQKSEMGKIDWFDRQALDEAMEYLGDALFAQTRPFSPFSYRHPINLILVSRFFDHWNSVVSHCGNCRGLFEKTRNDLEEYYKLIGRREGQRKQRMRQLTDDVLIVAISVVLSTIVQYLLT